MKALLFLLILVTSSTSQTLTLVVYKHEKIMESWVKGKLIRVDSICHMSGTVGPKTRQGDFQVPEGVYKVVAFNPKSSFVLSFGINYPNSFDKLSGRKNLGGDIYFHGSCVSAGCISFTDNQIREIYPFVKSFKKVDVLIFPCKPNLFTSLLEDPRFELHHSFWASLKRIQDLWLKNKQVPIWKPSSVGYEVLGTSDIQD